MIGAEAREWLGTRARAAAREWLFVSPRAAARELLVTMDSLPSALAAPSAAFVHCCRSGRNPAA